ncbi:MAG: substrate-binding domain-containing protein, partial [Candidatus Ornithospirochaeta sp.]
LRRESRIPFVVYDGLCTIDGEGIAMLTVDDRKGGLLAGDHLKAMGHRSVLCLTDNQWRMDEARCRGVIERVGQGEELLIPMDKDERWEFYRSRIDYIRSFTSVFAISDFYALDFMAFLSSISIRVPEDISVVGFDGSMLSSFFSLTTIEQDHAQRARLAVESVGELKAGECRERVKIVDVRLKEGLTVSRLRD